MHQQKLVSSNSTARGFQARAMQGGNSNSKLSIDSKRLEQIIPYLMVLKSIELPKRQVWRSINLQQMFD